MLSYIMIIASSRSCSIAFLISSSHVSRRDNVYQHLYNTLPPPFLVSIGCLLPFPFPTVPAITGVIVNPPGVPPAEEVVVKLSTLSFCFPSPSKESNHGLQ